MDVRPLFRRGRQLWLSPGSPEGIQTSLHLVRWKMSLHLNHCREIWPSFESGHLGVHSTWGRKHRVPLTCLLMREGSSWWACGKLVYLFNRRWNHSHPETIWGARNFTQVALLKLIIHYTWDGCLRESLEFSKGRQATCSIWCGLRDCYGANASEIVFSSIWFGVHRAILHSWGDISVLLILWQCSWGLSGVQSSKLRLLTSLIGKTELLCMQCSGIRPHLPVRGKSRGFSRVAAGTWDIFPSYGEDVHSKLEFVQRSQDTCLGMMDTSGM